MKPRMRRLFTLERDIRANTTLLLPNGGRVDVKTDIERNLRALIRTQNDAILAAQNWQKEPEDASLKSAFYRAFAAFAQEVLGPGSYKKALEAYDGDAEELCTQLDGWIAEEIVPLIVQASARQVAKRKRLSRGK